MSNADSGSRGAGGTKNTIKNYFPSQSDGTSSSSVAASFTHISKDGKDKDKDSATSTPREASSVNVVDLSTQLMPPPAKINPASKGAPVLQQQYSTIMELKKQNDVLRLGKEIAEGRVS